MNRQSMIMNLIGLTMTTMTTLHSGVDHLAAHHGVMMIHGLAAASVEAIPLAEATSVEAEASTEAAAEPLVGN